jgi:excisionase family DNA binding protein
VTIHRKVDLFGRGTSTANEQNFSAQLEQSNVRRSRIWLCTRGSSSQGGATGAKVLQRLAGPLAKLIKIEVTGGPPWTILDNVYRLIGMLTYEQAAEQLGVSTRTVRRLVKSGELPAAHIGASVRIRPEVVRAYVLESEQRMSDVSSSLVGNNDFMQGGVRPTPISAAFPGNGAPAESGVSTAGQAWQSWQQGDDLIGDESVVGVVGSGRVSDGIIATEPDAYPGMRPPGPTAGYGPDVPAWAQDSPGDGKDYDTPPDPALGAPSRPWRSGARPSDMPAGFVDAFPGGGQISGEPDSTGRTGAHVPRLRYDNGAPGVLP